jgi:subtilisin family serine protease
MKTFHRLTSASLIIWCLMFLSSLGTGASAQTFQLGGSFKADEVLVKYKKTATEGQMFALNSKWGGKLLKKFPSIGWQQVRLPQGVSVANVVALYKGNPLVESAEPNYRVHTVGTPNDPSFPTQWDMTKIQAPSAWNKTTGSNNVVVAVIDTGVDYTHPDLAANMWRNPGEISSNGIDDDGDGYVDDVYGIDAANVDSDPMDDGNHGTHCAGSIGAVGNNGVGIAGVNWNVKIMALKFMDSAGDGYTSDAIACLNYAVMKKQSGVNIVATSNSWSGAGYSLSLQNAFEAASNAGILSAVAAGNDGHNIDFRPTYPASFTTAGIISVAASDASDKRPSWSNYGSKSVDLAAPGANIYSTIPGGYATYSGTSMATPHVAGAIALLAAHSGTSSATQIKAALLAGVDVLSKWKGKVASNGRLNLAKALNALVPTAPPSSYRADLTIRNSSENASNSSGDGVYNTDGTNQNRTQTVSTNATATYFVNVQNDGSTADTFAVTAPATPAGWNAEYFVDSNNSNITSAIKGSGGWSTPSLAAAASIAVRVEITPGPGVPGSSNFAALITATSKSDTSKKDAVRATTSTPTAPVAGYGVDASIRAFGDADFVGENIINTDAKNQVAAQSARRNEIAVYYIRLCNSGDTLDTFKLKGGGGNFFWKVQYYDDTTNANISSAVNNGSWHSPQLVAGATYDVRLEVQPAFFAGVGSNLSIQATATSIGNSKKSDSVKATTTVASGSASKRSEKTSATSIEAFAQGHRITLLFGDASLALDKKEATKTTHYSVVSGGQELEVLSVQYEESSNVVVLETTESALQNVSDLTVNFSDLSTLTGETVSGTATLIK